MKSIENALILSNGDLLIKDYGKYRPDLVFVIAPEDKECYQYGDAPDINVDWDGYPKAMYGHFWVSKRGTECFRPLPKERASHVLLRVEWEKGLYSYTTGENPEAEAEAVYFRRASSNGGGIGYAYYVFPVGFRMQIDLDDI